MINTFKTSLYKLISNWVVPVNAKLLFLQVKLKMSGDSLQNNRMDDLLNYSLEGRLSDSIRSCLKRRGYISNTE